MSNKSNDKDQLSFVPTKIVGEWKVSPTNDSYPPPLKCSRCFLSMEGKESMIAYERYEELEKSFSEQQYELQRITTMFELNSTIIESNTKTRESNKKTIAILKEGLTNLKKENEDLDFDNQYFKHLLNQKKIITLFN